MRIFLKTFKKQKFAENSYTKISTVTIGADIAILDPPIIFNLKHDNHCELHDLEFVISNTPKMLKKIRVVRGADRNKCFT